MKTTDNFRKLAAPICRCWDIYNSKGSRIWIFTQLRAHSHFIKCNFLQSFTIPHWPTDYFMVYVKIEITNDPWWWNTNAFNDWCMPCKSNFCQRFHTEKGYSILDTGILPKEPFNMLCVQASSYTENINQLILKCSYLRNKITLTLPVMFHLYVVVALVITLSVCMLSPYGTGPYPELLCWQQTYAFFALECYRL